MQTKNQKFKIGSLFDGSGSFPLASVLCGIEPVFASEIEPFPIRVTRARFPHMKHYGDISQMNGAELEPVDLVTFSSPCQDLSVAGKRAGLDGKRSGLYRDAVRVIKQMLDKTNGEYPKFLIFENVEGMLSSNNGRDFKDALDMVQELGFIPDANILDAQHMGVPQRRKRVCIAWANVSYILKTRTNLSDSITLQLLTEILQINLTGLLKALGVEQKKSGVLGLRVLEDGLNRRMKLFSLQKESHLQMLQKRLDEMQAMYSKGQKKSDSIHGEGQMDIFMWINEVTKCRDLKTENQSTSIGKLLKIALEEGLQIQNESIISTWTRKTIDEKICFYLEASLNTLNVTLLLMQSLDEEAPEELNYYEWVLYTLTEMREFINAGRKNEKSTERMGWYDVLRTIECDISAYREQVERYFRRGRTRKILPQSEGLSGDFTESRKAWQGTSGSAAESTGKTGEQYAVDFGRTADRIQMNADKAVTLLGLGDGAGAKTGLYCLPNEPYVMNERQYACTVTQGMANTLTSTDYKGTQCVFQQINVPITMQIRSGKEGGGKGPLLQHDKSATLGCNNHQTLFQPKAYGICSYASNSMISDNPKSGCYEAETSRTLDLNGGNPACNQGGIAVCEPKTVCLEGNGSRPSHRGDGYRESEVMYTLNTTEQHAVAYRNSGFAEYVSSSSTLKAAGGGSETFIVEQEYIVRRLTPLECSRLQGLPDWWCDGLVNNDPTEEEMQFWRDVFETHRKVVTGTSKPKTDKQIRKWLAEEPNDGAMYKMFGNGIALPCFLYVIEGIKEVLERTSKEEPQF